MSKKEKNGKNKAKHTKLLNQKKDKKRMKKEASKQRLRAISNQSKRISTPLNDQF